MVATRTGVYFHGGNALALVKKIKEFSALSFSPAPVVVKQLALELLAKYQGYIKVCHSVIVK